MRFTNYLFRKANNNKRMDTIQEGSFSKWFYLPSEMGSTLKEKNLLPMGANSFLLA